jgi:hypothetical protein
LSFSRRKFISNLAAAGAFATSKLTAPCQDHSDSSMTSMAEIVA